MLMQLTAKKPRKHLARILIKPYRNDKNPSKVIYGIEKIYGPRIDDFHNIVSKLSALNFDTDTPQGIYKRSSKLYNDTLPAKIVKLEPKEYFKHAGIPFTERNGKLHIDNLDIFSNNVDYSNVYVNKKCFLKGFDVEVGKLPFAKELIAKDCSFQTMIDLSKYQSFHFVECNLRNQNFTLTNEADSIFLEDCKMPQIFDAKNYKEVIFRDLDLRNTILINFENVEKISFTACQLNGIFNADNCKNFEVNDCDLKYFKINDLKNLKTYTLRNCVNVSGEWDLSNCENLIVEDTDLQNVKLKNVQKIKNMSLSRMALDGNINFKNCLSLKLNDCDCRSLSRESFKSIENINLNACLLPERLDVESCRVLEVNCKDKQSVIFENSDKVHQLSLGNVILSKETSFQKCENAQLSEVSMKETMPDFIKNIKHLSLKGVFDLKELSVPCCEEMELYNCDFEVSRFRNLDNLKSLDVSECKLPENFEPPKLKKLWLKDVKNLDYWDNVIRKVPDIFLNNVTMEGVKKFENVKSLKCSSLNGNSLLLTANRNADVKISSGHFKGNTEFENMRKLELYSTHLRSGKLTYKNIGTLRARNNGVKQLVLENVQHAVFTNSEFINLESTYFKNVEKCTFESSDFLKSNLDVCGIKQLNFINCETGPVIFSGLSSVEEISITGSDGLKHIDFEGCKNVELKDYDLDRHYPKNLGKCKNIKLYSCDVNYPLNFKGCESLKIEHCYGLRSAKFNNLGSVKHIVFKNLSQLPEKIDITGCEKLVINDCSGFMNIKIKGIENVKDLSLCEVILPKKLNVSGCETLHLERCIGDKECEIIGLENVKNVSGPAWLLSRHKAAVAQKEKRQILNEKMPIQTPRFTELFKKLFCFGQLLSQMPQETMALKELLKAAQKNSIGNPSLKKGASYKKGVIRRKWKAR